MNENIFSFITIISVYILYNRYKKHKNDELTIYEGTCHCKSVTFKVKAPKHVVVWDCNCSNCYMRKNWHFIIPESYMIHLFGEDNLIEYKFNTKLAKHLFCKNCGISPFYRPRSNPDGYAITFACILKNQIHSYEVKEFDGNEWEAFIDKSDIKKHSIPIN